MGKSKTTKFCSKDIKRWPTNKKTWRRNLKMQM